MPERRGVRLLACALILGSTVGCAYLDMARRKKELRREIAEDPRPVLQRELAPEGCYAWYARIDAGAGHRRPLAAVAFADAGGRVEEVAIRAVARGVSWVSLLLPEGTYRIVLVEDRDGDGFWTDGEVVAESAPTAIEAAASRDGFLVDGGTLVVDRESRPTAPAPIRAPVVDASVLARSLDDPVFDPSRGELGLYNPAKFLEQTQGAFWSLDPPDPSKVWVVFVHGASGTPRDFRALVEGLDRRRFEPWFFYYPSGMPLDKLGAALATLLDRSSADVGPRFRVVLVAHSMGGLVARSALGRLCAGGKPPWLLAYVSFAAAYGGNDSAATGVKRAPVVVPSWRDLATGSDFLKGVLDPPLPKDLPFALFFGWGLPGKEGPDGAGDGVISLRSQLEPRAQAQAWRIHGFPESHMGILENPESIRLLGEWLDLHAPAGRQPPAIAPTTR